MPPKRGTKRTSTDANLPSAPADAPEAKAASTTASSAAASDAGADELKQLKLQLWLDEFDVEGAPLRRSPAVADF